MHQTRSRSCYPGPRPGRRPCRARLYPRRKTTSARTGPSTPDELSAFIGGYADDELVAAGAAVDTSRIDVDAARHIGQALDFYLRATAEQRGHLRGVSRTMLRAMAWAAVQGHDAYLALHTGLTELRSTRYARRETAVSLTSRGRAELVQLAEALRALAAGHAATIARIEHAAVQSHHADGLPAAIEQLVKIGRALVARPSQAMLVRLADGEAGISNDWLDACQDLARQIRDAGLTAQAPLPATQLSQADVDRWDGINLVLLVSSIACSKPVIAWTRRSHGSCRCRCAPCSATERRSPVSPRSRPLPRSLRVPPSLSEVTVRIAEVAARGAEMPPMHRTNPISGVPDTIHPPATDPLVASPSPSIRR